MDAKTLIGWYKDGFYTNDEFKLFVTVGWLTIEQYEATTGVDYETGAPIVTP